MSSTVAMVKPGAVLPVPENIVEVGVILRQYGVVLHVMRAAGLSTSQIRSTTYVTKY